MEKTYIDNKILVFILKVILWPLVKIKGIKINEHHKPDETGIIVVSPHTSNWDFLYGFYYVLTYKRKAKFLIKDSWCKGLMGKIMLYFGAIPVNRNKSGNMVDEVANFIKEYREHKFLIAVTPEGTRGQSGKWKEGFYYIAQKADCPIYMATIDYSDSTLNIWEQFKVSDNKDADIQKLLDIASTAKGKNPENQYPEHKKH
jgi:1-acyl-sn-glycerol-3-phosphate acyltransferase